MFFFVHSMKLFLSNSNVWGHSINLTLTPEPDIQAIDVHRPQHEQQQPNALHLQSLKHFGMPGLLRDVLLYPDETACSS